MNIVRSIAELRQARAIADGRTVGFVPTMGYLHAGHLSLIAQAREECDYVIVSIFVNPLQFGPQEDLETYPRDFERDTRLVENAEVDMLFAPTVKEMYPQAPLTTITVSNITACLCGATRPGHFAGVATVVAKMFHLVRPERAYFGLKDIQQVAVIKQMVADLNTPVTIVPCPTVREADGLAMSSRNVYLSAQERAQATVLYRALQQAKTKIDSEEWRSGREVENEVYAIIATQPLAAIDYVEMRTFPTMERVEVIENETYVIAVAVKFGRTRLIDNLLIEGKGRAVHVPDDDAC